MATLFTQLASAAYVCPMTAALAGQGLEAAAASPCAEMMSGDGTAFDAEQPALCKHHCQDGSQTFEPAVAASTLAPPPLPILTVRVPEPAALNLLARVAQQRIRERAPPPPHSITHCCYRL